MADKTIPALPAITDIDQYTLFPVDTGTETFRLNAGNLALFIAATILPPGITIPYAGATTPSGWLLADGSEVSRTTYAKLFAAIGTTHGSGDGSTTFDLPDLRGRVVAGRDDMGGSGANRITGAVAGFSGHILGIAGGDQLSSGVISGTQSIAHTHTMSHTHTMAHTHGMAHSHAWAHYSGNAPRSMDTRTTVDNSSITATGSTFISSDDAGSGGTDRAFLNSASANLTLYTSGVVSPPSGSGSSATTGAASSSTTSGSSAGDTGAMSAGSSVNGAYFSFTATGSSNVQPTIILNQIIKT